MIPVPSRVLVAREPVDFRKQIDGLAAVCEQRLGEEPLDGTLFIFRNRKATSLKALVWTHGGFSLVYKKLEKGRFRWPEFEGETVTVSRAELEALLEGLDLAGARRLSRWNPANQGDSQIGKR